MTTKPTELEKLLPRCKTKDTEDYPDLEHLDDSARCWNCRVWEAIDKREQAAELRGRKGQIMQDFADEGWREPVTVTHGDNTFIANGEGVYTLGNWDNGIHERLMCGHVFLARFEKEYPKVVMEDDHRLTAEDEALLAARRAAGVEK